MAKLRVDTDSYLQEIVAELNESMMSDPEVDNIQDPAERRMELDTWKESRLDQIGYVEKLALAQLDEANKMGFLDDLVASANKYRGKFAELRIKTITRYQTAQQAQTPAPL